MFNLIVSPREKKSHIVALARVPPAHAHNCFWPGFPRLPTQARARRGSDKGADMAGTRYIKGGFRSSIPHRRGMAASWLRARTRRADIAAGCIQRKRANPAIGPSLTFRGACHRHFALPRAGSAQSSAWFQAMRLAPAPSIVAAASPASAVAASAAFAALQIRTDRLDIGRGQTAQVPHRTLLADRF